MSHSFALLRRWLPSNCSRRALGAGAYKGLPERVPPVSKTASSAGLRCSCDLFDATLGKSTQ